MTFCSIPKAPLVKLPLPRSYLKRTKIVVVFSKNFQNSLKIDKNKLWTNSLTIFPTACLCTYYLRRHPLDELSKKGNVAQTLSINSVNYNERKLKSWMNVLMHSSYDRNLPGHSCEWIYAQSRELHCRSIDWCVCLRSLSHSNHHYISFYGSDLFIKKKNSWIFRNYDFVEEKCTVF